MKQATKTVTGKLVSTKPISLSNAARYISRFTSDNHRASQAVSVYLQRASDSFNSLVQFRKKLKGSHSRREEQVSQLLELAAKDEALGTADENPPGEKIKNSERKGKGKKNQEFELNKDVPLEIKQDKAVSNQVEVRKSSEIKRKDDKNQIFEVKNEETSQIGQIPDEVAEKKKKKKSGKEKVQKDETLMIEQAADVVFEIEGDRNFETKVIGKKNNKFDVKDEQNLQVEKTTEGVVEEKKRKKSVKEKGKNEETVCVQRGLDGVDADEKVLDEGGGKSKREIAQVEDDSEKREKKKKKKKSDDAEVKERYMGEDGKKAEDRKVGGETIDLLEQSGKKNVRKSEGFDKTTQDMMENEGDMNEAEGVNVKSRDKKKKRKESEREQEEEGVGGEGVQKQNSREVENGEFVDLADQSGKKKQRKADGNDEIKLDNVEVKGEMDRVEEGALEMKDKKKKRKKTEEAEKALWGEEVKNIKTREVDGGETIDLTEQIGKKKKRRKMEVEGK